MSTTRRVTLASAALLFAALLGGCATNPGTATPTPVDDSTVESPDDGSGSDADVKAAWLDGGRMVGIVTQGSSTCVPVADDVELADGVLTVTLVVPGDRAKPCTRDLVPRVTLVGLPEPVDPSEDLRIVVNGDGFEEDTDLDGVDLPTPEGPTDYLPTAGWTDDDGQFVILSWGSSSCVPVIEDVAATGEAEVTVTFQEPPADQVCTMDIAPRGTVALVEGLDDDSDVELVLTGGAEFDNIRIPIVG
ncbi:hypothetical protein [Microbacterium immunditiarum]|uniref:Lipoprotein n=1 Tax=Microbacterium immunditiarum TaxID=337480 RepID=A0A7Y9GLM1_9MICO|nr:hypothetical protein [Microbacterium immunditiarum]NYE18765.1 hypothetical protein [Microbacterium immunditiarum]